MSFLNYDLSIFKGRPVVLYEFTINNTVYRYTSTGNDFSYGGYTYTATTIKHGSFEISQDALKSDLEINTIKTLPLTALFIGQPPESIVEIIIRKIHVDDTDAEARIVWQGRVVSCSISGREATLSCESEYTSMKQSGLVMASRQCRFGLYSTGCGIDKYDYAKRISNITLSGSRTITHASLSDQDDGWWTGGFIELDTGERRMIISHSGEEIKFNYTFSDLLETGDTVTVYPGCDLSIDTCSDKFSNIKNFGGQPSIPLNNPFIGDKVS